MTDPSFKQKSAFDVEMEAYGCKMLAPTLVSEKHDELILGINVIKQNLSLSYVGPIGRQCLALAQPQTQKLYSSCLCSLTLAPGEVKIFLTRSVQSGVTEPPYSSLAVSISSGENSPKALLFPQAPPSLQSPRHPCLAPEMFWLQRL